jgi:hypothetical protein
MVTKEIKSIGWQFARHNQYEAQKGGVTNFAFELNLDTFVREVVQNINDQRASDKPVIAKFILEDLSGSRLKSLLELIGWNSGLCEHLEGVAKGDSHQQASAQRALDAVKKNKVRTLTIVDRNTNGLTGGETTKNGNFAMLCRHELVTDSDPKAGRGGAFGIGKSVLWAFSSASSVLFNSIPKENPEGGKEERFIGRAYLPTHDVGKGKSVTTFKPDGWFGHAAETGEDKGIASVRGAEAANHVANSSLSRSGLGSGTSILVPFFENPLDNSELSLEDLGEEIELAVSKWFWPAMVKGSLKSSVLIKKASGGELEREVSLPRWVDYFTRSQDAPNEVETIIEQGGVAKSVFSIQFPQRLAKDQHLAFEGNVELCLTKLTDQEGEELEKEGLENTVALVRGALMVVQYSKYLPDSFPDYVGVLHVGRAVGDSQEHRQVENFFRDAEPPAHHKWILTKKLKDNYRGIGAKHTLENLKRAMAETAKKLLGITNVTGEKVPKKLAELLAGRRKGREKPKRTETFHTNVLEVKWIDESSVLARANLKRMKGVKAWVAKVGLSLVNESGTKVGLEHSLDSFKIIKPRSGCTFSLLSEKRDADLAESWVPGFSINVPSGQTEIEIEFVGKATRLGHETVKRSRADFSVSFSSEKEGPDA